MSNDKEGTMRTRTETVKLRALLGEWDGQEVVLAGALNAEQWEAAHEELPIVSKTGNRWEELLADWKARSPEGTTNWREAWIVVTIPTRLVAVPMLTGEAVDV